jgi:hypothetical protein
VARASFDDDAAIAMLLVAFRRFDRADDGSEVLRLSFRPPPMTRETRFKDRKRFEV